MMFTIYDDKKNEFLNIEEPDSSYEYSYADYLKWKFEERVELIRGKIMKMTASNRKHQDVSGNLFFSIATFLKGRKCKVYSAPFDVRLTRSNKLKDEEIENVVQPDICVICEESKLDDKGCIGAPDLIIEILSPGKFQKRNTFKT